MEFQNCVCGSVRSRTARPSFFLCRTAGSETRRRNICLLTKLGDSGNCYSWHLVDITHHKSFYGFFPLTIPPWQNQQKLKALIHWWKKIFLLNWIKGLLCLRKEDPLAFTRYSSGYEFNRVHWLAQSAARCYTPPAHLQVIHLCQKISF